MSDIINDPVLVSAIQDLARGIKSERGKVHSVGRNSDSVLRRTWGGLKHSADYAIANPPYNAMREKP